MQAALVVGAAVHGDRHPPGGAVQQTHAQMGFQLLYRRGHGGAGHFQGLRRAGKTAGFHHPGEHLHGFEAVHGAVSIIQISE